MLSDVKTNVIAKTWYCMTWEEELSGRVWKWLENYWQGRREEKMSMAQCGHHRKEAERYRKSPPGDVPDGWDACDIRVWLKMKCCVMTYAIISWDVRINLIVKTWCAMTWDNMTPDAMRKNMMKICCAVPWNNMKLDVMTKIIVKTWSAIT